MYTNLAITAFYCTGYLFHVLKRDLGKISHKKMLSRPEVNFPNSFFLRLNTVFLRA